MRNRRYYLEQMGEASATSSDEHRVVEAWHVAALDLHLNVRAPFALPDADGTPIRFIALIEHFGSRLGTVVCAFTEWQSVRRLAEGHGYFASGINLTQYRVYDRGLFVETLRDWSWRGVGPAPDWY